MTEHQRYNREAALQAKGYLLFFIPPNDIYNKFASLIEGLANSYGGPIFDPHITLLGSDQLTEVEILRRTTLLANRHNPFSISLDDVNYEDFYFRALYVRAKLNSPLSGIYNEAKIIFEVDNEVSYLPHLSLLYGNYSPELKESIIQNIGKDQAITFPVERISIYKVDGPADEWHPIATIPLGT